MTLLAILSVCAFAGQLALVAIAGRELLRATTLPRGRRRRGHLMLGVAVLAAAVLARAVVRL